MIPSRDPSSMVTPGAAVSTPRQVATRRASGPVRLGRHSTAALLAVIGIILIYATDQILPPTSDRQAELRLWLTARATGLVGFGLLTAQVVFGLVLSHPHNKTTWRLSKRIFPWHDHLWVFVMAFLVAHIVSLIADPKADVGLLGAFIPGMSRYRSVPVALGTLSLYAFLITALTARQTNLLPPGRWLTLHRLAIAIFALTWVHGMLAGTDSNALRPIYILALVVVVEAGIYRYWAARRARTTFSIARDEPPERLEERAA
jgi:methionine sulfoxide reductase heme-binding subunit